MKKALCLLLCPVMVFGLCTTAFAGGQTSCETVTGEYNYCPSLGFLDGISNQTSTFTYSDSYFTHSGYEYDHDLAVMSMVLTQTSFASAASSADGWDTANRNFYDLIAKCGFKNPASNEDAVSHPGGETIGAYAAEKTICDGGQEFTLIALGVRGHNYGGEWYGNFDIGLTGEHAGFAKARDKVLSFLSDYVSENDITGPVKIWLTGYSRGAITANMAGGALDNGYRLGKASLSPDDLYCYTFETPQGVYDAHAHDPLYGNIHNILNHNDLVPLVSFDEWGHTRYGVDYYLPCRQYDPIYAQYKPEVEKRLSQLGWMNILGFNLDTIDNFRYISLDPAVQIEKSDRTQIEFYPEMISALFDTMAPTREYYVENLQADIQELSKTLLGIDTARLQNTLTIFGQKIIALENLQALLGTDKDFVDTTVDLFMEAMQEAQCADYNGDQVRAAVKNLAPKLFALVEKHPDTVLTLLGNILPIINAHFPEIGVTWMKTVPAEFFERQNPNYKNTFFDDVPSSAYYYEAVKWATENGIAKGYTASTFAPDESCTRAQVASFLWRAAGCPEPKSGSCKFVDVEPQSPHYKAIIWAAEQGITLGVDAKHFEPNATCTRAQIVTFIYRYEGSPKVLSKCPFTDVSKDSPYLNAITWAAEKGITLGKDAFHFDPDSPCTRAQIVTFLYREMA